MSLQTCLSVWKKIDCSSLFFLFQVVIKAGQKLTLELFWTIRGWKCVKVSHLNIILLAYFYADSPAYKLDGKEVAGVSGWHFFFHTQVVFIHQGLWKMLFCQFHEESKKEKKAVWGRTVTSCIFCSREIWETDHNRLKELRNQWLSYAVLPVSRWLWAWPMCLKWSQSRKMRNTNSRVDWLGAWFLELGLDISHITLAPKSCFLSHSLIYSMGLASEHFIIFEGIVVYEHKD